MKLELTNENNEAYYYKVSYFYFSNFDDTLRIAVKAIEDGIEDTEEST